MQELFLILSFIFFAERKRSKTCPTASFRRGSRHGQIPIKDFVEFAMQILTNLISGRAARGHANP